MSFRFSPKIVTDGLLIYLDAANTKSYSGSGTEWLDLSKSGEVGTLVNSPTFDLNSIVFDGVDDYVNTTFTEDFSTNDFTLDCWVYPEFDYILYGRPIIAKNGLNDGCQLCDFALDYGRDTNKFSILSEGLSGGNILYTNNTYTKNNWYNIVATRKNIGINSYLVNLYVNGILDGTTTSNFFGGNASNLIVGKFLGCGLVNEWLGKISSVKIYNRSLTQEEIQQNYNTTKSRFGL